MEIEITLEQELDKLNEKYKKQRIALYRKYAKQGNAEAAFRLGCFYHDQFGLNACRQAFKWFSQSAVNGYAAGYYMVAIYYYEGERFGLKQKDFKKYIDNLIIAAEGECVQAQSELADRYLSGCFVPQNIDKALELYKQSAENGNGEAYGKLAECYESGKYVKKDAKKSCQLFGKAVCEMHNELEFSDKNFLNY